MNGTRVSITTMRKRLSTAPGQLKTLHPIGSPVIPQPFPSPNYFPKPLPNSFQTLSPSLTLPSPDTFPRPFQYDYNLENALLAAWFVNSRFKKDQARMVELHEKEAHVLRNRTIPVVHKPDVEPNKQEGEEKETSQGFLGLGDDLRGVGILMILYILQGVPLGLASSIPILIQGKIKGYAQQAAFSIVSYPFSCKLLWAPIVDCFYVKALGRRKTWLVPLQYCIGAVMLYIPNVISSAMGSTGGEVNISVLAGWFCFLNFLAATQDIAVDGWAITMLSRKNVGWASTCNTVGQTIGYFLGYLFFLALDSPQFCNMFRGTAGETGCVSMESYLQFWGCVFVFTTTIVWIFVREKDETEEDDGCLQTYKQMLQILSLKNVLQYAGCIFVIKAAFAPIDSLSALKLLEAGLSKDVMVSLSAMLMPLQILLPLVITKFTNSQFPLNMYVSGVLPRLLAGLLTTLLVWSAFSYHSFGPWFALCGLCIQILYSTACTMMFVAQMMYNAHVSDVRIGGTYMTLLNTLINISGTVPQTFSLWAVDRLTISNCYSSSVTGIQELLGVSCYMDKETCAAAGGQCVTEVDGFFVLVVIGALIALYWKVYLAPVFKKLQYRPLDTWHVTDGAQRESQLI